MAAQDFWPEAVRAGYGVFALGEVWHDGTVAEVQKYAANFSRCALKQSMLLGLANSPLLAAPCNMPILLT